MLWRSLRIVLIGGVVLVTSWAQAPVNSSLVLNSSRNPSNPGGNVLFTATVTGDQVTGSVTFSVDDIPTGTVPLNGNTASFNTSTLTLGNHAVTAMYSGDQLNSASSATLQQSVVAGPTPVSVQVQLNPGWNFVAVQASQVTDFHYDHEVVAGFASFDGAAYRTSATPDFSSGAYLVFATASTTLSVTGVAESGGTLAVRPGWNLAGFASNGPIAGNRLTSNPADVLLPIFNEIQPNSTYVSVDVSNGGVVKPDRPYWIYSAQNAQVGY